MWPQLSADDKDLTAPLDLVPLGNSSQSIVFFDAGMVLVDLDWDRFLDRISAFYRDGAFDRSRFRYLMHQTRLLSEWECGTIGPANFVQRFRDLMEGSQIHPESLTRLPHMLEIKDISSSIIGALRPRVFELVEALREEGYATGILSNASPWHECDLYQRQNLRTHFDVILFSQDLGVAKPHPAIYQAAEALAADHLQRSQTQSSAQGLKAPARPHVYFVDDTPANVRAARHAGWRAALVDHLRDPELWASEDLADLSQKKANLVFGEAAAQRVARLFQNLMQNQRSMPKETPTSLTSPRTQH